MAHGQINEWLLEAEVRTHERLFVIRPGHEESIGGPASDIWQDGEMP